MSSSFQVCFECPVFVVSGLCVPFLPSSCGLWSSFLFLIVLFYFCHPVFSSSPPWTHNYSHCSPRTFSWPVKPRELQSSWQTLVSPSRFREISRPGSVRRPCSLVMPWYLPVTLQVLLEPLDTSHQKSWRRSHTESRLISGLVVRLTNMFCLKSTINMKYSLTLNKRSKPVW